MLLACGSMQTGVGPSRLSDNSPTCVAGCVFAFSSLLLVNISCACPVQGMLYDAQHELYFQTVCMFHGALLHTCNLAGGKLSIQCGQDQLKACTLCFPHHTGDEEVLAVVSSAVIDTHQMVLHAPVQAH